MTKIETVASKTFVGTIDVIKNGTRIGCYDKTSSGMFAGIAFVDGFQRSVGAAKTEDEIVAKIADAAK